MKPHDRKEQMNRLLHTSLVQFASINLREKDIEDVRTRIKQELDSEGLGYDHRTLKAYTQGAHLIATATQELDPQHWYALIGALHVLLDEAERKADEQLTFKTDGKKARRQPKKGRPRKGA